MTVHRKPNETETAPSDAQAPHLVVEKEVTTMADGKRQMIFYNFSEAKTNGHNGHGSNGHDRHGA